MTFHSKESTSLLSLFLFSFTSASHVCAILYSSRQIRISCVGVVLFVLQVTSVNSLRYSAQDENDIVSDNNTKILVGRADNEKDTLVTKRV